MAYNRTRGHIASDESEALIFEAFGVREGDIHEIKTANRDHNGIVLKARQLLLAEQKTFWLAFYDTGAHRRKLTRGPRAGKVVRENRRWIKDAFRVGGITVEHDGEPYTFRPVVVLAVSGRTLIQMVSDAQCPLRIIYKDHTRGHSCYPHYHLPGKAISAHINLRTLQQEAPLRDGAVRWVLYKHPDLDPDALKPEEVQAPAPVDDAPAGVDDEYADHPF